MKQHVWKWIKIISPQRTDSFLMFDGHVDKNRWKGRCFLGSYIFYFTVLVECLGVQNLNGLIGKIMTHAGALGVVQTPEWFFTGKRSGMLRVVLKIGRFEPQKWVAAYSFKLDV